MNARRDLYSAVMQGGPHSPDRSEKASELIDAYRAEVLREAIARLSGVAESASERKQPGLDHAVGVLLDMATGRDKSAGGEVR